MNGKILLDTNAVIALFRQDSTIQTRLAAASEVFVPVIVLGELHYGADHSAYPSENHKQVDQFAASCSPLFCDLDTARYYGQIKHALRLKGRPIPENDIWIAAIAHQYNLTLLSQDQHFADIAELTTESWVRPSPPAKTSNSPTPNPPPNNPASPSNKATTSWEYFVRQHGEIRRTHG